MTSHRERKMGSHMERPEELEEKMTPVLHREVLPQGDKQRNRSPNLKGSLKRQ
jgi:hypothetical protein